MANPASLPDISVTPNTARIGDVIAFTGKADFYDICYTNPLTNRSVNKVRLWTTGGMGYTGQRVIFDFHCGTPERVDEFAKQLWRETNASFSHLVNKNLKLHNTRIYASPPRLPPHYYVSGKGILKDELHFVKGPADSIHASANVKACYFAPEPLPIPTADQYFEAWKMGNVILEGMQKYSQISSAIRDVLIPVIRELEALLEEAEPGDAIAYEVMTNLMTQVPKVPIKSDAEQEAFDAIEETVKAKFVEVLKN